MGGIEIPDDLDELTEPDEEGLKANEYQRAASGSGVYFRQMMRLFGREYYGFVNRISDLQKAGIKSVFHYDQAGIENCELELGKLWKAFKSARLSEKIKKEEFDLLAVVLHPDFDHPVPEFKRVTALHMGGQEIAEFKIVRPSWPHLDRGEELDFIPTAASIGVSLPMWFGGLVDAVSELAKLMDRRFEDDLSLDYRIDYLRRYLHQARQMAEVLEEHAHIPGYIIDNSTFRFQHFRDGLRRVHNLLGRTSQRLSDQYLSKKDQNDDMEARIKRLIG
ncbi:MAG: hypothetical protein AAB527_00160 [Patescibacteria group bacterium]